MSLAFALLDFQKSVVYETECIKHVAVHRDKHCQIYWRDRQRDTERQTETERQRDRQTDRDTDRERERDVCVDFG